MYLCFPKVSAGSKLSLTALEQHCLIELPATVKMFLICTTQYSSPMWLWSYLKKYAGFMTLADSPIQHLKWKTLASAFETSSLGDTSVQ